MTTEPKFKNKDNLIQCLNEIGYFNTKLQAYSKKEVLDLISDLDKFQDYCMKLIEKEPFGNNEFFSNSKMKEFINDKTKQRLEVVNLVTNVWIGIWRFHTDIVPEKYKDESSL